MFYNFMNIPLWIPCKPEEFSFSLPVPRRAPNGVTFSINGIHCQMLYLNKYEVHNICVWNDTHNETLCYVQQICKKLQLPQRNESYNNTPTARWSVPTAMLRCAFLSCMNHTRLAYIYIFKMKSVTRKRCSLRYTYTRNCGSTKELKLTPHKKTDDPRCIFCTNLTTPTTCTTAQHPATRSVVSTDYMYVTLTSTTKWKLQ